MLKNFCQRFCMLPAILQALIVAAFLVGIAVSAGFPN